MTIPTIPTYPMPQEWTPHRVSWTPDPARAVLLVHDMQQYFVDKFPPGTSPVAPLIDGVGALLSTSRQADVPVVYTAQRGSAGRVERGLLHDFWGPGMSDGAEHTRIVAGLEPLESETVLVKHRYSAFYRTSLAELLTHWGRDQLIICGVYAHIGCLVTAFDAFSRDIETFLVADAVADFTPEDHGTALHMAARRCAATFSTADTVKALSPPQMPLDS